MRRGLTIRRALLLVWLIFALFPAYWTAVTAFKTPLDIYNGPRYIPLLDFAPNTLSWQRLLGDMSPEFFKDLTNSIVLATVSSLLSVALGAPAAYGLARFQYRYGGFYRNSDLAFLIVSQRIMPPIVSVLALYIMFANVGLLDTQIGMILAYTSFNLPLAVFLLQSFFEGIPRALEEAAAIDGYGGIRRLFRVVIPLASPGIAAAIMLSFFFAWNDFLFALMLTFSSATTLPVLITSLMAQMEPLWWLMSAVALIAVLPPAVVVVVLDRYMQRQVLRGGVR